LQFGHIFGRVACHFLQGAGHFRIRTWYIPKIGPQLRRQSRGELLECRRVHLQAGLLQNLVIRLRLGLQIRLGWHGFAPRRPQARRAGKCCAGSQASHWAFGCFGYALRGSARSRPSQKLRKRRTRGLAPNCASSARQSSHALSSRHLRRGASKSRARRFNHALAHRLRTRPGQAFGNHF